MKRIVSVLIFLLCAWVAGAVEIATPLPGRCTAFRPDVLKTDMLFRDVVEKLAASRDFGQSSSGLTDRQKNYWIVYSDRTGNTTYTAPGSSTPFSSLGFNEEVRIAKIERGYALVYSEPKAQEVYPAISSHAEWKGWVPMSKLLLWDSCPASRKGIYEKAMLCANLEADVKNGNLGKLFGNPDHPNEYVDLSINFTYYFVMKREGRMTLLATQNTMNGDSHKVLYGWVDENSFVAWNQRSCLEPTWEIEDVEYFAKNGTKVNIYDDAKLSRKASYITFTKKAGNDYSPYMYRMTGDNLRYPILDNSTEQLWNCSTFSSAGSGGAINAGTNDARKKGFSDVINMNLEELSRINIVVVIDGTKSMEKYFPPVRDALKEVNSFFQKSDKVKVGVLIYRDKQDGDYVTETFPFTDPANPQLAAFLDSGGKYGIKSSSRDKNLEEALYYGIDKALDSFKFNKDESNMIFVIGDCGNSPDYPEVTKAVIEQKLVEKNVTLMGFQVRNDSNVEAYTVFNNNLCELIKESLQAKFDALKPGVTVKAQLKKGAYEFTNNATSIQNALYVGSHMYVQKGTLDVEELKNQINNSVIAVKTAIDNQRDLLVDAGNHISRVPENSFGGNAEISGPVLDESWLMQRIGDKEYAENFKKTNTTVSFKGYTKKTDKASGRDYYKTVIFISREEFNTLMMRLKPLYDVAIQKGNDREAYVQAMKSLVQAMIPGISDAEMNQKGVDEVMGLASGLNASTMMTRGRSIAEIASTQAVNAAEYQTIIAKFKRQYLKLDAIRKKQYEFVREYNGAKYYWIPTEDLP